MSGLTKNYKAYNEYLKTMPEPIMPSQLPKRKAIIAIYLLRIISVPDILSGNY